MTFIALESLETRQLLAISNSGVSAAVEVPSVAAAPLSFDANPTGLTVAAVRQSYGYNNIYFQTTDGMISGDGSGQAIAIVVAYDDPSIDSDLTRFDTQFGLPDPPTFTKYVQDGLNQVDAGWSLETSLDVEWAHAMAPQANIILVEAKSDSLTDLFNAVDSARSMNGVVAVSMSWGASEFYGETAYDSFFTTPMGHLDGAGMAGGITFMAASGDSGARSGVMYPSSPYVLAVGGTTLSVGPDGSYAGEQGWIGSTGGFSTQEPAPAYQIGAQAASGLSYGLRTIPDVAAVGDPASGVSVFDSVAYEGHSGWFTVGGTSAAAPQWAGLVAVADQGLNLAGRGSMANIQATLYSVSPVAFHDVSAGRNGYDATQGYDLITGLGSPVADRVVAGVLASQGVYTVAGASTLFLPSSSNSMTAGPRVIVNGGDGGNTGSSGDSGNAGSVTPTPIFPNSNPAVVVVIVPVGSYRTWVLIPVTPPPARSPFSSAHHPVQPQVSTEIGVPISTTSFGQDVIVDSVLTRPIRWNSDWELAAVFDLVEPFQPPGLTPSGKFSRPAGTEGTTLVPPVAKPPRWLAIDEARSQAETLGSDLAPAMRAAAPLGWLEKGDSGETSPADSRGVIAGTAMLAGAAYWLALRRLDRQKDSHDLPVTKCRFQPRLRRCLTPRA
ncbi:MAG: S53 family peptidase [Planctomycetaceae bacterium]|nr:S53 family peptidase [Planctomycetaceae bacterium]